MIILVHYCFIVAEILDRHYNALFKECLKTNPSSDVIKMHLNEYTNRLVVLYIFKNFEHFLKICHRIYCTVFVGRRRNQACVKS